MQKMSCNGVMVAKVRADSIIVDPDYQRSLDDNRTKKGRFDWNVFGLPCVVPRKADGKFACTDGQHRLRRLARKYPGLMKNGRPIYILVQIVDVGTRKNESKLFEKQNRGKRNLTANDRFKALLFAGSEEEVTVRNILQDHGIILSFGRGAPATNSTKCAPNFLEALRKLGKRRFTRMVRIIAMFERPDYEGDIEREALKAQFIRGLACFMHGNPQSDDMIAACVGSQYAWSAAEVVDYGLSKYVRGKGNPERREKAVAKALEKSMQVGMRAIRKSA